MPNSFKHNVTQTRYKSAGSRPCYSNFVNSCKLKSIRTSCWNWVVIVIIVTIIKIFGTVLAKMIVRANKAKM